MMVIKRVKSVASSEGITIWLPLEWPVITLSVLHLETQRMLWWIAHEAFREVSEAADPLNIEVTRQWVTPITREAPSSSTSSSETVPLRYGEAPSGMRQVFPREGVEPAALVPAAQYLVVVRDNLSGDLRRFSVQLE